MKKAISAFITGLLLSGGIAALFEVYRRQNAGRVQEQTAGSEKAKSAAPRRERRRGKSAGLLDLNACTLRDLIALQGLDEETAGRVIENRPYRNKLDLVSRMVVPEATYIQFSHFVTVSG